MKSSSELKKIMFGVAISDGHIEARGRFSMYNKHKEYIDYLYSTLKQLTHTSFKTRVRHDPRGYTGYIIDSRCSKYLSRMRDVIYPNGRKQITPYLASRLDAEAFAHIWMCDGYLEYNKNRKKDKIQNIGYICFEAFPEEELNILRKRLSALGIETSLRKVAWGYGYRIRIGGENLQKFISMVYPYILPCFEYKTILFYKEKKYCLDLPSAEHFIKCYNGVDDIVRYSSERREN